MEGLCSDLPDEKKISYAPFCFDSAVLPARTGERKLQACRRDAAEEEARLRRLIAGDCASVRKIAEDESVSFERYLEACMEGSFPGEWKRDLKNVRERVRILADLRNRPALPNTAEDLMEVWNRANAGEVTRLCSEPVSYRRAGEHAPYGHLKSSDGKEIVIPGFETVPPEAIPAETGHLLSWMHREGDPECMASALYYLGGRIHCFPDGNGHLLRMLVCEILSQFYSIATLLAFLRRVQENRIRISDTEREITLGRADLNRLGYLLMRYLILAEASLSDTAPALHHEAVSDAETGKRTDFSKENAAEFLNLVGLDTEIQEKLRKKGDDEALVMAGKLQFDFTKEELEEEILQRRMAELYPEEPENPKNDLSDRNPAVK